MAVHEDLVLTVFDAPIPNNPVIFRGAVGDNCSCRAYHPVFTVDPKKPTVGTYSSSPQNITSNVSGFTHTTKHKFAGVALSNSYASGSNVSVTVSGSITIPYSSKVSPDITVGSFIAFDCTTKKLKFHGSPAEYRCAAPVLATDALNPIGIVVDIASSPRSELVVLLRPDIDSSLTHVTKTYTPPVSHPKDPEDITVDKINSLWDQHEADPDFTPKVTFERITAALDQFKDETETLSKAVALAIFYTFRELHTDLQKSVQNIFKGDGTYQKTMIQFNKELEAIKNKGAKPDRNPSELLGEEFSKSSTILGAAQGLQEILSGGDPDKPGQLYTFETEQLEYLKVKTYNTPASKLVVRTLEAELHPETSLDIIITDMWKKYITNTEYNPKVTFDWIETNKGKFPTNNVAVSQALEMAANYAKRKLINFNDPVAEMTQILDTSSGRAQTLHGKWQGIGIKYETLAKTFGNVPDDAADNNNASKHIEKYRKLYYNAAGVIHYQFDLNFCIFIHFTLEEINDTKFTSTLSEDEKEACHKLQEYINVQRASIVTEAASTVTLMSKFTTQVNEVLSDLRDTYGFDITKLEDRLKELTLWETFKDKCGTGPNDNKVTNHWKAYDYIFDGGHVDVLETLQAQFNHIMKEDDQDKAFTSLLTDLNMIDTKKQVETLQQTVERSDTMQNLNNVPFSISLADLAPCAAILGMLDYDNKFPIVQAFRETFKTILDNAYKIVLKNVKEVGNPANYLITKVAKKWKMPFTKDEYTNLLIELTDRAATQTLTMFIVTGFDLTDAQTESLKTIPEEHNGFVQATNNIVLYLEQILKKTEDHGLNDRCKYITRMRPFCPDIMKSSVVQDIAKQAKPDVLQKLKTFTSITDLWLIHSKLAVIPKDDKEIIQALNAFVNIRSAAADITIDDIVDVRRFFTYYPTVTGKELATWDTWARTTLSTVLTKWKTNKLEANKRSARRISRMLEGVIEQVDQFDIKRLNPEETPEQLDWKRNLVATLIEVCNLSNEKWKLEPALDTSALTTMTV